MLKRFAPFLSMSVLLVLLGTISLTSNILLSIFLPLESIPKWRTPHDLYDHRESNAILHVVTTRFMQNQPDLVALGKARLLLFETFCLPTLINQNVTNFIWFIMVDPELDITLLDRLKAMLVPFPHFYLVLSNDSILTPQTLINATSETRILTGDHNKLYSLMLDLNRPLLLETRLDADDGLHSKTLFQIQETARSLPVDSTGWQIVCNGFHFEWRNNDIFVSNNTIMNTGNLRLVKENICVTPGYTFVRHRKPGSTAFPPWPELGHQQITKVWPHCNDQRAKSTTNCWVKLGKYPAALRPRTITSAGMRRVETMPGISDYDNQTEAMWKYVEKEFMIMPQKALLISRYMQENLASIVKDNLKGQW